MLVLLALLLALSGCHALAGGHLRRVRAALGDDLPALTRELRGTAKDARAERLQEHAALHTWPRELASRLVDSQDDAGKVAAANELLVDLAYELEADAHWPAAALRLSVFSSLLAAVALYLTDDALLLPLLGVLGAAGAMACAHVGGRGRRLAERRRREVDQLLDVLAPNLAKRAPPTRSSGGDLYRSRARVYPPRELSPPTGSP